MNRLRQRVYPGLDFTTGRNANSTDLERSSSTSSLVASLYEKDWTGSADEISGDDDDDDAMPQREDQRMCNGK